MSRFLAAEGTSWERVTLPCVRVAIWSVGLFVAVLVVAGLYVLGFAGPNGHGGCAAGSHQSSVTISYETPGWVLVGHGCTPA